MNKTYDVILLLGLKLNSDGTPDAELNERIRLAAKCMLAGMAKRIIVCGGKTPDTPCTEASVMAATLQALGVDAQQILLEDKSQTTYENIRNAKTVYEAYQPDAFTNGRPTALIITSDYHLFRPKYMANKMGFAASGMAAPTPNDDLKKKRKRMERLFFINYWMGWETGNRKRPKWYDRAKEKIVTSG